MTLTHDPWLHRFQLEDVTTWHWSVSQVMIAWIQNLMMLQFHCFDARFVKYVNSEIDNVTPTWFWSRFVITLIHDITATVLQLQILLYKRSRHHYIRNSFAPIRKSIHCHSSFDFYLGKFVKKQFFFYQVWGKIGFKLFHIVVFIYSIMFYNDCV